MSRVPETRRAHRLSGKLKVSVIKDEDRRLSAEFKVESLDAFSTRCGDSLASGRVAGDGDHVNARVARECRANF